MNTLFSMERVCKGYKDFALEEITLSLEPGTVLGLVGANGAGKTTLLRLLLGTAAPDAGTVTLFDTPVQQLTPAQRDQIGYVPDTPFLPGNFTLGQTEPVLAALFPGWDGEAFRRLLAEFRLPTDKKYSDFSRGMQMKASVAVALAHHPRLLLLDEATGGLDPIARDQILDCFRAFALEEGHGVVLASHIVSDLEKICDRVAFVYNGRLRFVENKDDLEDRYGLLQCAPDQLESLPPTAVIGVQRNAYGATALVERSGVHPELRLQKPTLEDIILFSVRGNGYEEHFD